MTATTALLADSRFPSGGHAHSGGFEAASAAFSLADIEGLERFLLGRLHTAGRTEGCLVAAAMHRIHNGELDWLAIDRETEARIVSPTLRRVSRSLGRQWLRGGRRIWRTTHLSDLATFPDGPHQVSAFAAVANAAGIGPLDAVTIHLHHLGAGVASAAIRLLGLDPFDVQGVLVSLTPTVDELALESVAIGAGYLEDLPGPSGPMTDLLAEEHALWEMRLFQS